jgi:hypothetical protein
MTDRLSLLTPATGLSEMRHNWDIFPADTMAYDSHGHGTTAAALVGVFFFTY